MDHILIFKKALIYRIFSILITFGVSFFFTQKAEKSILISLITESIQFCIYFLYEMCWNEYALMRPESDA
jgi:uncharacterized membrane protein